MFKYRIVADYKFDCDNTTENMNSILTEASNVFQCTEQTIHHVNIPQCKYIFKKYYGYFI